MIFVQNLWKNEKRFDQTCHGVFFIDVVYDMGVSLNGGTPQNAPKNDHFLGGKPMVVGETHRFRKKTYVNLIKSLVPSGKLS